MSALHGDDLHFATVVDLGRALRAKKITAVELTRLFLNRLAAGGPRYNALAELTPELAARQAQRADLMLRRGHAASPLVGWFIVGFSQRRGGRAGAVCPGFRDVGEYHDPRQLLRDHRTAADLGAGQPRRRDGTRLEHGQDRTTGAQRGGLRLGLAVYRRS